MTGSGSTLRYEDVDHSPAQEQLVEYLRRFRNAPDVRRYKQRSFELMGASEGAWLLEAGCGSGEDALELSKLVGTSGQVVAIDRSARMLRSANEIFSGRKIAGDIRALPFRDAQFDGCRADRVLQHLSDPGVACAELRRITRKGGRVVVCDTDWDTLTIDHPMQDVTRRIVHGFCDSIPSGQVGRQLTLLLKNSGLRDVMVEGTALTFQDYGLADEIVGLSRAAAAAAESGTISIEDATGWLVELEDLGNQNRFFCSVTGFAAAGIS